MPHKLFSLLLCLTCLASCGRPSKKSKEQFLAPVFESKVNRGLAFTGVDLYYSSSDLFYYDYQQGLIFGLLYGQSGDSALWSLNQNLVLFNRTPTHHNYVLFEKAKPGSYFLKQETRGEFEKGDPNHVLSLNNGHWLVSYFGKGKVTKINPETGKEEQKLKFLAGTPFHPASMFKRAIDGITYIFIAAIGIEVDPANYKTVANGKQGIFLVREDEQGLTVLNQGKPIALPKASNPGFYHTDEIFPMVAGLCYVGTKGCRQSIEYLDIPKAVTLASSEQILTNSRNLDEDLFTMNGSLCDGSDADSLFANVVFNKDYESFKKGGKYLVNIENKEKIGIELVHHYAHPDSSGSYLLLADKNIRTLYFGDISGDRQASLNIIHHGIKEIIPMQRIPYHGALVPQ
ncbi:MAG: hypothetical protein AB8G05_00565 [Oligoflexales bacterium]